MRNISMCRSAVLAASLMLAFGACSEDEDDNGGDGDGNGTVAGRSPGAQAGNGAGARGGSGGSGASTGGTTNNAGRGNTAGSGSGIAGSSNNGNTPECAGLPFVEDPEAEEECVGVGFEAEPTPADLFIMMDRSISQSKEVQGTGITRLDALKEAVQAFVEEAQDTDIRVGIGFFGRTGGRDDELDCDVDYYAKPWVEIGPLSEVGDDLVDAIAEQRASGLTPTEPALEGAHQYAAEYAADNPNRAVSVVLVTDGYPTQCVAGGVATVSGVADIAERARKAAPYVRTFVIGLAAGGNLNTIARYGGTNDAYLVDEGDTTASFARALKNITNTPVPCRFEIPEAPNPGEQIDPTKVQVAYHPEAGESEEIPKLNGADSCNDARARNGGWFYDNNADPRHILVCPCTCSRFGAGQVDIRIGCEPSIGIR